VTESHQFFAGFDFPPQDCFCARRVSNLEHHVERRPWRPAVQRTLECSNCADHR
jgi:hypothetical protein